MRSILAFIVVSLLFIACQKEDSDNILNGQQSRPINFQNLDSNQISKYVHYQGTCEDDDEFIRTGNEIFLEIERQDDQIYFKETLTAASPWNTTGTPISQIYEVKPIDDYLLIPDRSSSFLFWFYANDTLWVDPIHDVDLIQEGCFLVQDGSPFIGNDIAFVESFEWGDFHMKELTAVSCEPFGELDGYLFYDKNGLHNSYSLQFGMFDESVLIEGWLRD